MFVCGYYFNQPSVWTFQENEAWVCSLAVANSPADSDLDPAAVCGWLLGVHSPPLAHSLARRQPALVRARSFVVRFMRNLQWALAYAAVFATLCCYTMLTYANRHLPSSTVALYTTVQPIGTTVSELARCSARRARSCLLLPFSCFDVMVWCSAS